MRKFLAIVLLLLISSSVQASLTFAVDGDRVTHNGTALGTITNGTIGMWVYITDNTARQVLIEKLSPGGWSIAHRADVANDPIECFRLRATANVTANANSTSFGAFGINKWVFLAFTWNTAGADADQRILVGDLSTLAVGPSAYTAQTVGTGTIDTTNADVHVGTGAVTTRETHGRIAWVGVWSTALTNAQIQQQQFRPRCDPGAGCVFFVPYGYNGLGSQIDYSGNAIHGTITGTLVVSDHVPLGALHALLTPLPSILEQLSE